MVMFVLFCPLFSFAEILKHSIKWTNARLTKVRPPIQVSPSLFTDIHKKNFLNRKVFYQVMTVIASPGQGPDRSTEVSYTDTKVGYRIMQSDRNSWKIDNFELNL